jgi:hypothetical protein
MVAQADLAELLAVIPQVIVFRGLVAFMVALVALVLLGLLAQEQEQFVLFGLVLLALHGLSHLRILATYECAGSYCYCCWG